MKKVFTTLLVYLILPFVAFAAFDSVQLSTGSTLVITVGGTALEFTLTSGNVEALTVSGSSFSIDLQPSSVLVITSNDRRNFDYSPSSGVSTTFTCGSSSSRLDISASPGASGSFAVTPLTTTCTVSSGGGGGGSGGGGSEATVSAPAPAPVSPAPAAVAPAPAVAAIVTQMPAAPAVAQPSPVAQLVSPVFNKDLARGAKSDDVRRLQELLASDKNIYPEGLATGFFGPATLNAVKRFQAKYGLPQVGRVGPQTRAKLQEVFAGAVPVAPVVAQPAPAAQAVSAVFNTSLEKGMTNDDVKRLQQLLATDPEFYPEAVISGRFGNLTEKAVQRFQKKYGLATEGDSGYGFVGPKTRTKLQEVFRGQPTPVQPSAPQSADDEAQKQALQKQLDDLKKQLDVLLKQP